MNLFKNRYMSGIAAAVAVAILLAAYGRVTDAEKRAATREKEAAQIAAIASELVTLRSLAQELEKTFTGGEPVVRIVERIAGAERLTIASTQSAGEDKKGPYPENLTSIRFSGAALGPLHRVLNNLESAKNGLLIRELTIRKSVDYPSKLDAELVVAHLEIKHP